MFKRDCVFPFSVIELGSLINDDHPDLKHVDFVPYRELYPDHWQESTRVCPCELIRNLEHNKYVTKVTFPLDFSDKAIYTLVSTLRVNPRIKYLELYSTSQSHNDCEHPEPKSLSPSSNVALSISGKYFWNHWGL
jgi:hypothetical protein